MVAVVHEFLNLDEVAERLGWSDEQVAAELARRAATAPYEPTPNDLDRLDRVAHLFAGLNTAAS